MSDSKSLSSLRTSCGLTQRAVAKSLGLSPGNYNEIESGKRSLPAHHIAKLAELFSVPPRTVIESSGSKRLEKLLGTFTDTQGRKAANDALPLYGRKSATAKGLIDLNGTTSRATFPNGSFAIEILGDEMSPRYEPGEHVLVDTTRAPDKGCDCVARNSAGHAFVRRYLGTKDGQVLLQQFNPSLTLKIPQRTITALYAVTGRVDKAN